MPLQTERFEASLSLLFYTIAASLPLLIPLIGQNRSDCFLLKVHAGNNIYRRILLQLDIQITFAAQRYFKAKQANYLLNCIDWIAVPFVRLTIKKKGNYPSVVNSSTTSMIYFCFLMFGFQNWWQIICKALFTEWTYLLTRYHASRFKKKLSN